jgi:hypothetical protein
MPFTRPHIDPLRAARQIDLTTLQTRRHDRRDGQCRSL